MLVGAAEEVSAGAGKHQRCRILTAVRQGEWPSLSVLGRQTGHWCEQGLSMKSPHQLRLLWD